MNKINVVVWNEFRHEKEDKKVSDIYPKGIHNAIADFLRKESDFDIKTATLDEPEHGLPKNILDKTDVLIWWGHMAHDEVDDKVVDSIQKRILEGMGLIVLHSGHYSKIFKRLMGTTCKLNWREADERERLWVIEPYHQITQGINSYIELAKEEMYGERFDVPEPDKVLFISWFQGGEVFRSGLTYTRGFGKIFYFQPGHESYPNYYNEQIQKILCNAVHWANFSGNKSVAKESQHVEKSLEKIV
ncbi:MAG: ThuA domain-containing protein [Elusimicrobia bacterium]|nr:ThuA domain-containing protein [Elusimicrobiota bacterium]